MDDKRYQVFVSSTYRDLFEHRQLVMKALLQVNAIPAGMELFPASDDDAWTLIQRVIDTSDYYVVIIGGKYGSMDKDGISYTEKEFDYAAAQRKPIMAFLHGSVGNLPRDNTETDPSVWDKLSRFRAKAEQRHCKYWTTPEQLTIAVLTSYHHVINTNPAIGWVHGDRAKTIEELEQLTKAQQRVRDLEAELDQYRRQQTQDLSAFAQGEDQVKLRFHYWVTDKEPKEHSATYTWAEVFCAVALQILDDPAEQSVARALERRVQHDEPPQRTADGRVPSLQLLPADLAAVKVQFLGLHLITVDYFTVAPDRSQPGTGTMSVWLLPNTRTETFWKLTARGSDYLAQLMAIRRAAPTNA